MLQNRKNYKPFVNMLNKQINKRINTIVIHKKTALFGFTLFSKFNRFNRNKKQKLNY